MVGGFNKTPHNDFIKPNVDFEHFGINPLRYMAAKIWAMVPYAMKNVNDTETFKNNISSKLPLQAMSRLCFMCRLS